MHGGHQCLAGRETAVDGAPVDAGRPRDRRDARPGVAREEAGAGPEDRVQIACRVSSHRERSLGRGGSGEPAARGNAPHSLPIWRQVSHACGS
ncbi:hypothetical protein SLNWT_3423 [Streptomyces albus]|uniref:Uncharacterized protein n=1 Tax=Streptomyces albus (strain ATCC 21838 / DSM 41398 / FERM P-419 / JCM 4703 / NBRC 107858) TaxID=1081613 RepID=A0A0B5EQC2_STRA4|nr:hypothetical protein SLNWT_3423 [Streptomyces albus]AOU78104.1 hypothetical protein SLNHY_3413 [Streptomyces albus]